MTHNGDNGVSKPKGMILDTSEEGRWFDYCDGIRFKLRFHPDPPGSAKKVLNLILEDWENVFDLNGNPVECNSDGILAFLQTNKGRVAAIWMMSKMNHLHDFLDMELLKKKFETLSNGTLTSQKQMPKDVPSA